MNFNFSVDYTKQLPSVDDQVNLNEIYLLKKFFIKTILQMSCNSSWAFSAVTVAEYWILRSGSTMSLSVQVDLWDRTKSTKCIRGENNFRCFDEIAEDVVDLVLVDQKVNETSSILYEFSERRRL